jgi:hypothetical protein
LLRLPPHQLLECFTQFGTGDLCRFDRSFCGEFFERKTRDELCNLLVHICINGTVDGGQLRSSGAL